MSIGLTLLAFLFECLIYLGAGWFGWNLLGRPSSPTERYSLTGTVLLLGWFTQSLLILICGLSGWLSPYALALLIFLPLGILILDRQHFIPWLKKAVHQSWLPMASSRSIAAWVIFPLLVFLAILHQTPVFFFDTLHYHYGQPLYWLIHGRISPIIPDIFSYVPMPERMHNLWSLGLLGETMANFIPFLNLVLAALTLAGILYHRFQCPPPWPTLAALTLLTVPALWEIGMTHLTGCTIVWAMTAYLELYLHPPPPFTRPFDRSFQASETGLAIATGILACFKTAVIGPFAYLAWAFRTVRRSSSTHRRLLRYALILFPLTVVPLLPWLFLAQIFSGSFLAAGFPYLSFDSISSTRWFTHLYIETRHFSAHVSSIPVDFILNLKQFYQPDTPSIGLGGFFGLPILIFLPVALLLPPRSRSEATLRILFFLGLSSWYFTFRLTRYAVFLIPITIILVLLLLYRTVSSRIALICILVTLPFHVTHLTKARTLRNALKLSIHQAAPFISIPFERERVIPASVDVCLKANQLLNPQRHRILFIGEYRYYPCHIPFTYFSPFFRHPFERLSHHEPPEVTWDHIVRKRHITHLIYSPDEVHRLLELSPSLERRLQRWIRQRGNTRFVATGTAGLTFLIELHPDSPP